MVDQQEIDLKNKAALPNTTDDERTAYRDIIACSGKRILMLKSTRDREEAAAGRGF